MENNFTNLLTISVFVTGTIWITRKIKKFINKKNQFKKNIEIHKKSYYENHIKPVNYIDKLSYLGSFFPMLFLILIIRCFFYEPFYIPSESMMPTLLPGDYILVKKNFYNIKNPFTNKPIFTYHLPKRGDIVVFNDNNNHNKQYVKRIIGLPGDKISYDSINKILTIYQDYQNEKYNKKILVHHYVFDAYNETQSKDIKRNILDVSKFNHPDNILNYNCMIYKENIDKYRYNILITYAKKNQLKSYFQQNDQPKQIWLIPPKHYFVMGDNRDNSLDSRYLGFVSENNILGKVDYIWMSIDKKKNQWPTGINFHRIGKIL
ncbi:signal peptidase I [Buchnera aphidicola]|uniref:signal peptidase I n=1 Tax=Buchnera aphidicola TaxID=9 RepID=UPI0034642757